MKRIINVLLILTFLLCYLEWPNHAYFVFQMEYEFFFGGRDVANSFTHPLILFPFIGQVLLLITLFLKKPPRAFSLTGMLMLCPLVFMILLAGIMGLNFRMIASTIPFILTSIVFFKYNVRRHLKPGTTS